MANAFVRHAENSGIYYAFNSWLRNADVQKSIFRLKFDYKSTFR